MKKLLNTLYVTTQKAYLNKEGETVVVSVERVTKTPGSHPHPGRHCLLRAGHVQPFLMVFALNVASD